MITLEDEAGLGGCIQNNSNVGEDKFFKNTSYVPFDAGPENASGVETVLEKMKKLQDEYLGKKERDGSYRKTGEMSPNSAGVRVYVPMKVVERMRFIEQHLPQDYPMEFGMYLKADVIGCDVYISADEFHIPKQIVSHAHIDYDPNDTESGLYNSIIHRHPDSCLSFSQDDMMNTNTNHIVSLLYVMKNITLAAVNLPVGDGSRRLTIPLNLIKIIFTVPEFDFSGEMDKYVGKFMTRSYGNYNPYSASCGKKGKKGGAKYHYNGYGDGVFGSGDPEDDDAEGDQTGVTTPEGNETIDKIAKKLDSAEIVSFFNFTINKRGDIVAKLGVDPSKIKRFEHFSELKDVEEFTASRVFTELIVVAVSADNIVMFAKTSGEEVMFLGYEILVELCEHIAKLHHVPGLK